MQELIQSKYHIKKMKDHNNRNIFGKREKYILPINKYRANNYANNIIKKKKSGGFWAYIYNYLWAIYPVTDDSKQIKWNGTIFNSDGKCFLCLENTPNIICCSIGDYGMCDLCLKKSIKAKQDHNNTICCFCYQQSKFFTIDLNSLLQDPYCSICMENEKDSFCSNCNAILYCNQCIKTNELYCDHCDISNDYKKIYPKYDI